MTLVPSQPGRAAAPEMYYVLEGRLACELPDEHVELRAGDHLVVEDLEQPAILTAHDVGKIQVPREILTSAAPLSEAEWKVIRHHPRFGAAMLTNTFMEDAGPTTAELRGLSGHTFPIAVVQAFERILPALRIDVRGAGHSLPRRTGAACPQRRLTDDAWRRPTKVRAHRARGHPPASDIRKPSSANLLVSKGCSRNH